MSVLRGFAAKSGEREVLSEWPAEARPALALVGEAPGQEEIEDGRPFVGAAGRTLDRILRTANIDRGSCFVGNIFTTKLEGNSVAAERTKRGDQWQEFEAWNVERLGDELKAAKPDLVVALGETSLRYMTGQPWTVASVRGTTRPGAGRFASWRIFTTYPPDFVMRQWKMFVPTVADLTKANAIAREPKELPKRRLNVEPNIEEVESFLYGPCCQTDLLSVDIETAHRVGIIKGVAFAPSAFEGMYVPFAANTPNGSYWTLPQQEIRAWKAVRECLASEVPKLGQNFGLYDLPWLYEKAGIFVKNFREDLMMMHKCMFPELPAGLEFMAGCYSEQGPWKSALRKSHDGKKEE